MPFHPLPISMIIRSCFSELSLPIKIFSAPCFSILITFALCIEIILLPFRWMGHEIYNLYSDMDDSEWTTI